MCCCGCGALFLVVALIFVVLLLTPPPGPPPMTPVQKARAEAHVAAAKEEIEQVKKAHVAGKRRPFTLTMTEQDINTFIKMDAHIQELLQRAKIEDAYVRIEDGRLRATATRSVGGAPVTGTVGLRPGVGSDGQIRLHVVSVNVGRLGLPASGSRYLDDDFVTSLARKGFDSSVKLDSVTVQNDAVVLSGDAK
jgi:uncharacterized protein YpmS